MGTICVIALSLVCYIMFEIEFLRGFDHEKVMKSHGIHGQNPCMNAEERWRVNRSCNYSLIRPCL